MEVPTFKMRNIDMNSGLDITDYIEEVDLFFRRIVQHVMNRLENTETESVLCHIITDTDSKLKRSTFILEREGWCKALDKALEYFARIEEYETCDLIKQMKQTI